MPPVVLCDQCKARLNSKPMFYMVKHTVDRGVPTTRYTRLCTKCHAGEPGKRLKADGYVDHLVERRDQTN